ncbi:MAG: hypothetical protein K6C98_00740, partial [Treponema sp.]|nr:hypothetical protein [Treponema sp.]
DSKRPEQEVIVKAKNKTAKIETDLLNILNIKTSSILTLCNNYNMGFHTVKKKYIMPVCLRIICGYFLFL